jgi:hypothetical protein
MAQMSFFILAIDKPYIFSNDNNFFLRRNNMTNLNYCHNSGCDSQDLSFFLYNGNRFCKNHYKEIFLNELHALFEKWNGIDDPPERLKYLIGRYYSENEIDLIGQPSLTKAIVHHRSYDWKKTDDGAVFTVTRFPINRKYGSPYCDEVHQTWIFNPEELKFTFLSEVSKGLAGVA